MMGTFKSDFDNLKKAIFSVYFVEIANGGYYRALSLYRSCDG
jgi:hypothetical protein